MSKKETTSELDKAKAAGQSNGHSWSLPCNTWVHFGALCFDEVPGILIGDKNFPFLNDILTQP